MYFCATAVPCSCLSGKSGNGCLVTFPLWVAVTGAGVQQEGQVPTLSSSLYPSAAGLAQENTSFLSQSPQSRSSAFAHASLFRQLLIS